MLGDKNLVSEKVWLEAQKWERDWWNCRNTYGEETKQLHYAKRMGLELQEDSQGPFINLENKNVLDVGGGPVSLLLKCRNLGNGVVIDPCDYPAWVRERYRSANIVYWRMKAEDMPTDRIYDETWIYNVLQHVENPELVVSNMRRTSKIIRVFDWLEISGIGHPQYLVEKEMSEWFGGYGRVEMGNGGLEYFGIFRGDHYE